MANNQNGGFFEEAEYLRKNARYDEALQLFEAKRANGKCSLGKWEVWSYAMCLKKMGKYDHLLQVCRSYYPVYPLFDSLNTLYAWAIYYSAMKDANASEEQLLKAAEGIVRLCSADNIYSPYNLAVKRVLEMLASKQTFPATTILQWIARLKWQSLDKNPGVITDLSGRRIDLASDFEKVLVLKAKAHYFSGNFDSCISTCKSGLMELNRFHYGNEHWIRRLCARSQAALGNKNEALSELKAIYAQRKEWFIAADIAQLLIDTNAYEQALFFLIQAADAHGDMEKKIKVYKMLATVYTMLKKTKLATDHYELVNLIRNDFNWASDAEVRSILNEAGRISGENGSSSALYSKLKDHWKAEKSTYFPRQSGKIRKIMPDGRSGFVESNTGGSFYFMFKNIKGLRGRIPLEGNEITFELEEAFDKKKNKVVMNAVALHLT